jgi:hypothetical protein
MGSPGIKRISTNTSNVIPMKVGTTRASRVKTNRSMPFSVISPEGEELKKRRSSEGHSALVFGYSLTSTP